MTDQTNKVPIYFWIIGVIALLWNLMGCYNWFLEYNYWTNPDTRIALPEDMRDLYNFTPGWTYVVFAIAVLTGALGSIGLLLRKSWASIVLTISLIAVLVQMAYWLIGSGIISEKGMSYAYMPIFVIAFAAFLLWFSKLSQKKGWIS